MYKRHRKLLSLQGPVTSTTNPHVRGLPHVQDPPTRPLPTSTHVLLMPV